MQVLTRRALGSMKKNLLLLHLQVCIPVQFILKILVWINTLKEESSRNEFTIVFDPGGFIRVLIYNEEFYF